MRIGAVDRGAIEARFFQEVSFPIITMDGRRVAIIKMVVFGPEGQTQASAEAQAGLVAPETIVLSTKCNQPIYSCGSAEIVGYTISKLPFPAGVPWMNVRDKHHRPVRTRLDTDVWRLGKGTSISHALATRYLTTSPGGTEHCSNRKNSRWPIALISFVLLATKGSTNKCFPSYRPRLTPGQVARYSLTP